MGGSLESKSDRSAQSKTSRFKENSGHKQAGAKLDLAVQQLAGPKLATPPSSAETPSAPSAPTGPLADSQGDSAWRVAAAFGRPTISSPQVQLPVQLLDKHTNLDGARSEKIQKSAAQGIKGTAGPLPYLKTIQNSFGHHDVSGVKSHSDSIAKESASAMGAAAFATGNHVAFNRTPDLFMAAHEAAHVVQQRGEVQLFGGVGKSGDKHEQHANAVASLVVSGKSAEGLLDRYAGGRSGSRPEGGSGSQSGVQQLVQLWGEPDHYIMGQTAGQQVVAELEKHEPVRDKSYLATEKERDPSQPIEFVADDKKLKAQKSKGKSFLMRDAKGNSISYGGANRFSGDLSPKPMGKTKRGHTLEAWPAEVAKSGKDYQKIEFYKEAVLLATNANHFYPLAGVEYRRNHQIALQKMWMATTLHKNARSSADTEKAEELARQAIIFEGFSGHFLADCFAAGHLSPHALGRIGAKGTGMTVGARVNTWHDLFNSLPNGIPTTLGRFHGDYAMDGHDLTYISAVIGRSLLEVVMPWYVGEHYHPSIILPAPNVPEIMRDPVAGPLWAQMCADYQPDLLRLLGMERRTGKKGVSEYAIYRSTTGQQASKAEAITPILENVFGGTTDGPKRIDDTKGDILKIRGKVYAILHAIQHILNFKGGWQIHAGITQGFEKTDVSKQKDYKFRIDFKSAKLAKSSDATSPILPLSDELAYWLDMWRLNATITDHEDEDAVRAELARLAVAMKRGVDVKSKKVARTEYLKVLDRNLAAFRKFKYEEAAPTATIAQGPEADEARSEEAQRRIELYKKDPKLYEATKDSRAPLPIVPESISRSPITLVGAKILELSDDVGMKTAKSILTLLPVFKNLAADPRPKSDADQKMLYALVSLQIKDVIKIIDDAYAAKSSSAPLAEAKHWLSTILKKITFYQEAGEKEGMIPETARRKILLDLETSLSPYFALDRSYLALATARVLT